MSVPGLTIRPAAAADLPFMYGLAPRLAGVADLAWRNSAEVMAFQQAFMEAALEQPKPGSATLVAVDGTGERLGFIHAEPQPDPFTEEAAGYVSLLATTAAAEGRGVAGVLIQAAEDWARAAGYRFLALDVFASNSRGRAFYARKGYGEETLRLVKPLGP